MSIDRRSWDIWKFSLFAVVGAFAIILTPILIFGARDTVGTARVLIPTGATALGVGWATWMATLSFRRLDEFQQEASKFAWYWGGSMGVAASAVGYVFVGQGGLHWLDPAHFHLGRELFRAFQWGYLIGIAFPLVGFIVARIWWTAAKAMSPSLPQPPTTEAMPWPSPGPPP